MYVSEMNKQELFDHVVNHLAEQKKQSVKLGTSYCMYRYEGLKCSAGSTFPDEVYREEWENICIDQLIRDGELSYPNCDTEVLIKLQMAHDNNDSLTGLQNDLYDIARYYGFNSDSVSKIKEWNKV